MGLAFTRQKKVEPSNFDILPVEDWAAITRAWNTVPKHCKSAYTNLYAEAARRLRWHVTVESRGESRISSGRPSSSSTSAGM